MNNVHNRVIGLAVLGLFYALLMLVGSRAFLASVWVLTQHCNTSGMSPWTRELYRFVWFALD